MAGKSVILWKMRWLPESETFIRSQQDSLRGWTSTALGLFRTASPLARVEDVLLGRASSPLMQKLEERVFAVTGYHRDLRRFIASKRPTLLHVHFLGNGKGIVRLAKRLGVPVLVTAHGSDVTGIPSGRGLAARYSRWRARRVLQSATRIVAVSRYLAKRLIVLGADPSRVVVSYVGTEIVPVVHAAFEYDIVFVGRLVPNKGARLLLEALTILKAEGVSPRVAIGGSGPELEMLKDYCRREGLDVSFVGHVHHQEVPALISSGRIFCAPSTSIYNGISEAFGVVFLEAAMQERPVVAFAVGGVPEAVEHGKTGLLVSDGNVAELAEALQYLFNEPAVAEKLGHAGRDRVLAEFDRVSCARSLEAVYDQAIQSR